MNLPVADLHCDLLSYLEYAAGADEMGKDIGCALPYLKKGNVELQVLAMFTATERGSANQANRQSFIFLELLKKHSEKLLKVKNLNDLNHPSKKIKVIAAIENASGLCEEHGPLQNAYDNLEKILSNTNQLLYIGLTHHLENRFGGGNSTKVGLKTDGKELLNYLDKKKIAIDFSHTSDNLAYDILNHITKKGLSIPIMASHSNYRSVFDHPRNLPDDIAKEIILQKGLIGLNFLRAFINPAHPEALYKHVEHGLKLGGEKAICLGADYFFASDPDPARTPYFFPEHENAGKYPAILERISGMITKKQLEGIARVNIIDFINRIWQ